jgi:hypothetical protein
MRILVTLLVIVAVVYGLYNFTMAAYGWFQMANLVDEIARPEATKLASSQGSSFGSFDNQAGFGRVREGILKGARDVGVNLRPEDVNVKVADGMLDIHLNWTVPMVAYRDKTYLDMPMTLQRGFLIRAQ